MPSETGFPSSHQLKSYVAFKSRLKLAASAVLSADAGLLVVTVVVSKILGLKLNGVRNFDNLDKDTRTSIFDLERVVIGYSSSSSSTLWPSIFRTAFNRTQSVRT